MYRSQVKKPIELQNRGKVVETDVAQAAKKRMEALRASTGCTRPNEITPEMVCTCVTACALSLTVLACCASLQIRQAQANKAKGKKN